MSINPVSLIATAVRGLMHGTVTTTEISYAFFVVRYPHRDICTTDHIPLQQQKCGLGLVILSARKADNLKREDKRTARHFSSPAESDIPPRVGKCLSLTQDLDTI